MKYFTNAKISRRGLMALGAGAGLSAVIPAFHIPAFADEISELNQAINKAGAQRMLSQRMAKAYLFMSLDPKEQGAQAKKIMEKSMGLFTQQLRNLQDFAPSSEIKQTYSQLAQEWLKYKAQLNSTPSAANAKSLLNQAEIVLNLSEKGTQQLEAALNKPVGILVNKAGAQRMLSQRIAAYCYANAGKIDPQNAKMKIKEAKQSFLDSMEMLSTSPLATEQIKKELKIGQQQWIFLNSAIDEADKLKMITPQSMSNVLTTSENLLSVMEKVTHLYSAVS